MRDGPMTRPKALRRGDRVAVVAPASPFPRDEFQAGLDELRSLGFEPVYEPGVFDRRRYLAGDAADRAAAFTRAWSDPSIAAVLTARGGYGSVQVLPHLDVATIVGTPKLLVGYSDITALLGFVTTHAGVVALHGPTVTGRFGRGPAAYDRESFLQVACEARPLGRVPAPGLEALVDGRATGPVFGGNLTQLAASLGTPWAFDPPAGCLLFLEDVNERPYRLDRLMTQLDQAGLFARARGLVFGEMPGCDEADGSITAREICGDFAVRLGLPAVWGLPSGHTAGAAVSLPLGVAATVTASAGGAELSLDEPAVC